MKGQRTSDNGQRQWSWTRAFAIVLCPLSLVLPASASAVFINEVQSSNDETPVTDDRGEAMDWAELYNAGETPVDISGWGFSDKGKKTPFKWTFPNGTVLPARGYLVVICDKTATSKTYPVAPFGLSADGETLTLTDASSNKVDEIEFGSIPTDCSFGRAGGELKYFAEPTPGGENAKASYDAPVTEPVVFSRERGIFTGNETLTVTLSHPKDEATIWYTTDHSDPSPTNGKKYAGEEIVISKTTIVRATAVVPDALPCRNITSQSYIFLDQVKGQEKPANAPDIWCDAHYCTYCKKIVSSANPLDKNNPCAACPASYTISKSIFRDDKDAPQKLVDALKTGTVLSITMSDSELFDEKRGLYTHPSSLDIDRAASIEWVTGNHVFGTDCGVAMQGGWARQFEITPKKSFHLKFRARFGAGALEVPVLDDVGCAQAEFKSLILRGENNQSWGRASNKGTSMADQFIRDLQGEMSGFQSHGTHVHLFLNGLYWGVYNLCERGDANWASTATGWGGEAEDYDVLKHEDATRDDDDGKNIDVRDGSADAYTNLINYVKSKASARAMTDDVYRYLASKIDIDSYIDYYMLQCYIGNQDWPDNNWVAFLSEKQGVPLRYLAWDVEYSLFSTSIGSPAGSGGTWTSDNIHKTLVNSPEYKLRFADRVNKHFFNDGVLTIPSLRARYQKKAEHVRKMIFGEVARWGAYYPDHSGTGNTPDDWKFDVHYASSTYKTTYDEETWETEARSITNTFFGGRWNTYKGQLSTAGLWTMAQAATARFEVSSDGKSATLQIPSGTDVKVYYTTDGSDPREAFTGNPHGQAYVAGQRLESTGAAPLKARARNGSGEWSALSEIQLVPPRNRFLPTDNGRNWDDDANWGLGRYPNAADDEAVIGVPEKLKKDKTWRNIHIDANDIAVGPLEFANGGLTNRIDTGDNGGGDLTLCSTVTVTSAGAAIIDLDAPHKVALGAHLPAVVAAGGELILKGAFAGNGKKFEKLGAGTLTLACTNAADAAAIDKLQCSEGVVAVTKPLRVGSVTKKTGEVWVKAGEEGVDTVLPTALVSEDAMNPNLCLFVPTEYGEGAWYGGVVSRELNPASESVYVLATNGTADVVAFDGKLWRKFEGAQLAKVEVGGYQTYRIDIPYFGPPRVAVRFDANGGTGAQALEFWRTGEDFVAPECTLQHVKRGFAGWAVAGGVYQPGEVVPGLDRLTDPRLGATWEELPPHPVGEPEVSAEIVLGVGQSTNIMHRYRKNLRHWLVGSTNGLDFVSVTLSPVAEPTGDYAAYQWRTSEAVNEMSITLTGKKKGEEDVFLGRQYKFKDPEFAAKYHVRVQ